MNSWYMSKILREQVHVLWLILDYIPANSFPTARGHSKELLLLIFFLQKLLIVSNCPLICTKGNLNCIQMSWMISCNLQTFLVKKRTSHQPTIQNKLMHLFFFASSCYELSLLHLLVLFVEYSLFLSVFSSFVFGYRLSAVPDLSRDYT
jgi:hypothetical protein